MIRIVLISDAIQYMNSICGLQIRNVCSSLFQKKEERLKPLGTVIVDNFAVPDHLNPNDKADLYCYGLGAFFYLLQDYKKALDSCDKAINENPTHVAALYNKGVALDELGNHIQAIQYYDKVLAIEPKYVDALYNKGLALDSLGKDEDAKERFDKARQLGLNI